MNSYNRIDTAVERSILASLDRGVSGRQTALNFGVDEATVRRVKARYAPSPAAEATDAVVKQENGYTGSKLFLGVYDTHSPEVHRPTFKLLLKFMESNKVDGFVFGGDQNSNDCISHHNKDKALMRPRGSYYQEERFFDNNILKPIESRLDSDAQKIYILGNHDDWERQYVEENPEFEGKIERHLSLGLAERGWQVIPCGESYTFGKLTYIHGETLGGSNHAKKAVDTYCTNVLYGHFHTPQSATKTLPHNKTQKWQAWCSPILGNVNPYYLRNRPSSWLNGFTVIEYHASGNFNVFPLIVSGSELAYGGKVYKA